MPDDRQPWIDLPKELLEKIGEHVDSRVDIPRLRSVCTSWWSSVSLPSFDEELPCVLLNLPFPLVIDTILSRNLICRIELVHQNPNSSESKPKGWLTQVGESKRGKLQLLHPVSGCQIESSSISLNLQDFRFIELGKAFKLKLANADGFSLYGVTKVVPFPISASCKENNVAILAIYEGGKLGYWEYGDTEWELLDDCNFEYDDIIVYKSQLYAVDRSGIVWWINSSLKVIQYSPILYSHGSRKTLVESCGDLCVVDRFLDGERIQRNKNNYRECFVLYNNDEPTHRTRMKLKTIGIRVYKLDEEWGRWEEVKSLGDRVFVLGMDCSFSISSVEFYGGKGNSIYFTDDDESGLSCDDIGINVFQLEDCSIKRLEKFPEYSEIFLPPQQWIDTKQAFREGLQIA